MKSLLLAALFTVMTAGAYAADAVTHLVPPKSGVIKVAFVLSEGATVIDFAGPWEVFADTMLSGTDKDMEARMPFELYTVAPSKTPIRTAGNRHPGMLITPDYSFGDAPEPDVVVIGAQSGGPGLSEWLQKVHADNKVIVSVCTGAFKVAQAGLLNGKQATTHHEFTEKLASSYPDVKVVRSVRYVQSDPIIFTAGGLTSGVDLALHIVAEYYGNDAAKKTADYMEYQGTGWKSNQGVAETQPPVGHQEWQGDTSSGLALLLHVITKGESYTATMDSPKQHVAGAATTINVEGNKVSIAFAIPGHPATFAGTLNDTNDTLTGSYAQDGNAYPLTLVKKSSESM